MDLEVRASTISSRLKVSGSNKTKNDDGDGSLGRIASGINHIDNKEKTSISMFRRCHLPRSHLKYPLQSLRGSSSSLRQPSLQRKPSLQLASNDNQNVPSEEAIFHPKHALFSISETFFATHESLPLISKKHPISSAMDKKKKCRKSVYKEIAYKWLHRPYGLAFLYHLVIVSLFIVSCVSLNVRQRSTIKEILPTNSISDRSFAAMSASMKWIDGILAVILIVELVLRLWSCSFKPRYTTMLGKVLYFYDFFYQRFLDFFGIVTFSGYICFSSSTSGVKMNESKLFSIEIAFRFAHLIQIMQVYRVLFLLFRPLRNTISDQMSQLLLAMFGMLIVVILCAFLLYAFERNQSNSQLKTIFDTCWLSFVTFSTIGYGDMVPYLHISKFILCVFALVGVIMFYLPSHIIGNGLSMALREQRRITFKYLSTAELIRFAITNQQIQQSKSYTGRDNNNQRSQLLTGHIANSAKKIQPIIKNGNLKINYKNLSHHHHNHYHDEQEEEELWNKLLFIGEKGAGFDERATGTQLGQTRGGEGTTSANGNNHCHGANNNNNNNNNGEDNRIMAYFQSMDMNRYSNDNAILWYNLNLIEEDIAEMDELINLKIIYKIKHIKRQCKLYRKLVNNSGKSSRNSNNNNNNDHDKSHSLDNSLLGNHNNNNNGSSSSSGSSDNNSRNNNVNNNNNTSHNKWNLNLEKFRKVRSKNKCKNGNNNKKIIDGDFDLLPSISLTPPNIILLPKTNNIDNCNNQNNNKDNNNNNQ